MGSSTMVNIPDIKLNNGMSMPVVGFGTWKIGRDTCADQVYGAIKAGYRLIDGACSKQVPTPPLKSH